MSVIERLTPQNNMKCSLYIVSTSKGRGRRKTNIDDKSINILSLGSEGKVASGNIKIAHDTGAILDLL